MYTLMDSPEKILYAPVYIKQTQAINRSDLGLIYVPPKSTLDIDDVFGGRRTCLIDYILYAGENGIDEATHVAYIVKTGSNITPVGWECEYERRCKLAQLVSRKEDPAGAACDQQKINISHGRTRACQHGRVFPNVLLPEEDDNSDGDMEDRIFDIDYSDSWDVELLSDEEPQQRPEEREYSTEEAPPERGRRNLYNTLFEYQD